MARKKKTTSGRGRKPKNKGGSASNGANLGFEAKLWAAADKLRGHMDAAVYKHVVLGLIFLKYISDAFQEKQLLQDSLNQRDEVEEALVEARLF